MPEMVEWTTSCSEQISGDGKKKLKFKQNKILRSSVSGLWYSLWTWTNIHVCASYKQVPRISRKIDWILCKCLSQIVSDVTATVTILLSSSFKCINSFVIRNFREVIYTIAIWHWHMFTQTYILIQLHKIKYLKEYCFALRTFLILF